MFEAYKRPHSFILVDPNNIKPTFTSSYNKEILVAIGCIVKMLDMQVVSYFPVDAGLFFKSLFCIAIVYL